MPWSRKPYRWVRIQMPKNPNYWGFLGRPQRLKRARPKLIVRLG